MADDITDLHLQLFVCLELVSCHCTWLCWMFTLRSYASGPHFPPWCCYGSPRSRQPYVGTQVGVGHFQLEVLECGKGCRQQGEHNNIMSIHEAWTYDDLCSFLLFFFICQTLRLLGHGVVFDLSNLWFAERCGGFHHLTDFRNIVESDEACLLHSFRHQMDRFGWQQDLWISGAPSSACRADARCL